MAAHEKEIKHDGVTGSLHGDPKVRHNQIINKLCQTVLKSANEIFSSNYYYILSA